MDHSSQIMVEQIARAVAVFQQQRTGHEPKSVSVVLTGETVVVTLHGALSPAEQAMAQTPEGASKVREFHRELFNNDSDELRKEIEKITGMAVREAVSEVEPRSGTLVQVFTTGTMVQVFQLSGRLPTASFEAPINPTGLG